MWPWFQIEGKGSTYPSTEVRWGWDGFSSLSDLRSHFPVAQPGGTGAAVSGLRGTMTMTQEGTQNAKYTQTSHQGHIWPWSWESSKRGCGKLFLKVSVTIFVFLGTMTCPQLPDVTLKVPIQVRICIPLRLYLYVQTGAELGPGAVVPSSNQPSLQCP